MTKDEFGEILTLILGNWDYPKTPNAEMAMRKTYARFCADLCFEDCFEVVSQLVVEDHWARPRAGTIRRRTLDLGTPARSWDRSWKTMREIAKATSEGVAPPPADDVLVGVFHRLGAEVCVGLTGVADRELFRTVWTEVDNEMSWQKYRPAELAE